MPPMTRTRAGRIGALTLALLATACGATAGGGGGDASATTAATTAPLDVSPQNSTLLVGENRLGIALEQAKKPILGATVTLQVQAGGRTLETQPLEFAGHEYKDIPYYLGVVSFPSQGPYHLAVTATTSDGRTLHGAADVPVTTHSPELPIGFRMPALDQPLAKDVGGDLSKIDTGVPPDQWHDTTVAQGLAEHRPMVIYFGEPGRCTSGVCGPTVSVLQELCTSYCSRMLFEHIEVHYPAQADSYNPAFTQMGFQSEPWTYFVNAQGVVADRYEGPVTLDQLRASADGTLAGHVPAVDVSVTS